MLASANKQMQSQLLPINNSVYNSPSAECQRITLRQPNAAVANLDTFDGSPTSNVGPAQVSFSGNRIFLGGIKRISALDLNILWHGLNVNPRNNLLRFSYGAPGDEISYEITIPEGSYTSSNDLMVALISAMNVALGSTEFFWTVSTRKPGFGTITANAPFFFIDSPAVKYGTFLWNLKITPPVESLDVGQIGLIYTRFIDVVSYDITKYVKNPNVSTTSKDYPSPGNLLARYHINFPNQTAGYYELSRRASSFQNFEISDDLQTFELQFRDEWGQPLYLTDNNHIIVDLYTEA